jgi:SAM-dependent methyltransferase
MSDRRSELYVPEFYQQFVDGSIRSAKAVLSILYRSYQPNSVIDVGCGIGSWLSVAESLGSATLRGLDGTWVNRQQLSSKNIDFSTIDFEKEFTVGQKYDLCICVEVAEHIAEARAVNFVRNLCEASDVVLFSAAIKHQGGINHINEQWQSYWVELFHRNGYECLDIIRPAIWENEEVEWWYRQNIFLFVRRDSDLTKLDSFKTQAAPIWNLVHPLNYVSKFESSLDCEKKMQKLLEEIHSPTLRFCVACTKRYIASCVRGPTSMIQTVARAMIRRRWRRRSAAA